MSLQNKIRECYGSGKYFKLFLIALLLFVILTLFGFDKYLKRKSNIYIDLERERLFNLRDIIIRFNKTEKRPLKTLKELVPLYCSEKEIFYRTTKDGKDVISYHWNAQKGILSCPKPFVVKSFFPSLKFIRPIEIKQFKVVINPLNGEAVFSQPPNPVVLDEQSIVIEAENMQELTYGWEIEVSKEASGGAYVHLKEGRGDYESEDKVEVDAEHARSGNFYNIGRDMRPIKATLYFYVPKTGYYYAYARTMAQRSHCSNVIYMQFNDSINYKAGSNENQPYSWVWNYVDIEKERKRYRVPRKHNDNYLKLNKGVNKLNLMAFQDGVRVDQIILSPRMKSKLQGNTTFSGGFKPSEGMVANVPKLNLTLSVDTLNITENHTPKLYAYVYNRDTRLVKRGVLKLELIQADGVIETKRYNIKLDKTLTRFPCEISIPKPLIHHEYLVKTTLYVKPKKSLTRHIVLSHAYDWMILGPLPYMKTKSKGCVEKGSIKKVYTINGKTFTWHPFNKNNIDPFGLLDFGKMFYKRTFCPEVYCSLYGYTKIDVKEAGDYILQLQADDNIIVWVNGKEIATIIERGPPIRTAKEVKVFLKKGENTILFRLNQKKDQWQMGMRLRTIDYYLPKIKGIQI